jgi:hypothetical protein
MDADPKLLPLEAALMVGRRTALVDVIEWRGELYVVMLWYASQTGGLRKPQWIVPLKALPHAVNTTDPKYPRYLISVVFPEQLHWAKADRAERQRYKVIAGPDFAFSITPPKTT